MTAHDLEAKQADVALDPVAGTLRRLRERALPVKVVPDAQSLTPAEQEFVEKARAAQPHQLVGLPAGMTMERAGLLAAVARAHVSPDADPLARPGAGMPCATPEARVKAGFDPGAGAGPAPALNVSILALDLGTKTGYALRRRDGTLRYGTEVFTPQASWTPGQKWQRYRAWLSKIIAEEAVNLIVFEDVKAHGKGAVLAAHAYGGFRAMLEMVADGHRVRLVPVGVGVVKKHWTGKGNADKGAMVEQAKARGFRPETDNDADALAILHWAIEQEAGR